MSTYVKPSIMSVVRASKAIAQNAHGSDPSIKAGALQDVKDLSLCRSTSGAYQADE